MIRVTLGVVLAAVVQFCYGFAFFGMSGAMDLMTARAPDDQAVMTALAQTLPASGTYFVPGCPGKAASEDEQKAAEARMAAGPNVQTHFTKAGFTMAEMPAVMGKGLGLTVIAAAVAAALLAAAGLKTYGARVAFVTGLGVMAMLCSRMSDFVWFGHDWKFVAGQVFFGVTAWLLSGVVLAAFVRPVGAAQGATEKARPSLAA